MVESVCDLPMRRRLRPMGDGYPHLIILLRAGLRRAVPIKSLIAGRNEAVKERMKAEG